MSEPIRVLLVDDHIVHRRGLEAILQAENDIDVVGGAVEGPGAVALACETRADVVLMDFRTPHGGLRVTSAIKQAIPMAKIVIFTASDDGAHLIQALKAGAVGCLPRSDPPHTLVSNVRSAYSGTSFISPGMASRVMNEFASMARDAERPVPAPRLTNRELEVLRLIVEEHPNFEIRRRLYVSENTVKNHVRNVLEKLHLYARLNL